MLDSLWIHQQAADRRAAISSLGPRAATSSDIGDIAVIRDEGDVIVPANAFDLKGVGLRFTRNSSGGYDVRQSDSAFRTAIGNRVTLTDDDTARADVAFSFPFFSGSERTAFVNSDGNITFREGDNASTDRSVGRLLTGPAAGGGVPGRSRSERRRHRLRQRRQRPVHRHLVRVRGFDSTQTTTAQTTLLPDGTIEMRFAAGITLPDAVIGAVAWSDPRFPHRRSERAGADLRRRHRRRASASRRIPISTSSRSRRRSIAAHPDAFDQLVIWTDTSVVSGNAFAFESTVANADPGHRRSTSSTSRVSSAAPGGCRATR